MNEPLFENIFLDPNRSFKRYEVEQDLDLFDQIVNILLTQKTDDIPLYYLRAKLA